MHLALFDFDGTVTTKETTEDFIYFAVGKRKGDLGRLLMLPVYLLYLTKAISHHRAKELFLRFFFKGWDREHFLRLSHEYAENHVSPLVKTSALERIRWHQEQNHHVVVVSGSLDVWLRPWCEKTGVELICTGIDLSEEKISGRLATRNCYAEEKVNRINSQLDLAHYSRIYAYGDSRGDRAMLALADEKYYRHFK